MVIDSQENKEGLYENSKMRKQDRRVAYSNVSEGEIFCGNCRYYIADSQESTMGGCTLVEGPVMQSGISLLYEAIRKYPMTVYMESIRPTAESEKTGTEWKVQIIDAGVSKNNNDYPLDVLHRDKDIFENAPVFASIGDDHNMGERGVNSVVGFIKNVERNSTGLGGTLHISDSDMKEKMLDWYEEGILDTMMGLSIVAYGEFEITENNTRKAIKLSGADSVDIVRKPAAGGKVLAVTESQEDSTMTPEEIKALLAESRQQGQEDLQEILEPISARLTVLEGDNEEEEVVENTSEIVPTDEDGNTEWQNRMFAEWRTKNINDLIREAKLPNASAERLRTIAKENLKMETFEIETMIKTEKEHLDSVEVRVVENLQSSGRLNSMVRVDEADKWIARFEGMFDMVGRPAGHAVVDGEKIPSFRGFTEAYASCLGISPFDVDRRQMAFDILTGMSKFNPDNPRRSEMLYTQEALFQVSSLGEITADVMHKALGFNYRSYPQYQDWTKIARPMSVSDYKTWRQAKTSTYADLTQVVEGGTYPDITHITDEETTVQIIKRGGIVPQITRELIINDNMGALAEIPMKLATAALRTLYKSVFDTLVDNDTFGPDSVALFHSSHGGNTGTAALSISSVNAMNIIMRSQTSYGGNDILGAQNVMKKLIVPNELQGLANRISNPNEQFNVQVTADTDQLLNSDAFAGLEVIVVDHWTDANDWFGAASGGAVGENSGIGVVFLNGNQEPELFTQSDPTQGEMFTMDVMNIKIRHEWQKVLLDYRPFIRQVVA